MIFACKSRKYTHILAQELCLVFEVSVELGGSSSAVGERAGIAVVFATRAL